tara:strand:- start:84 stop:911 length:828 start_codon:yes stop_codon:yes gene_type:complete
MSLLKQIECKDIQNNQMCIYFLGQSGYVLKFKELIIYIDPYLTDYIENPLGLNDNKMFRSFRSPIDPESISKCDAIICTHSHVDHMDPWTINKINSDYKLFSSIGAYEKSDINLPQSRITFLHPEKTYKIRGINIVSFPAAHYDLIDEFGRPDCLSILIQWNGINLFFWGDGIRYDGQYELLSKYSFEYFFAPINGRDKKRENEGIIGNIKENELAEFCSKLSIKNIIPNHYDMFINNTGSIDLFKKEIYKRNPEQSIISMNCGDNISNIRGYNN